MSRKNKILNWCIERLVLWYNKSSYRRIKIEPDIDPVMMIVPTIQKTEPPPVPKTDPEVIKKAISEWFENDFDRILYGIRTLLNQEEPWVQRGRR